MSAPVDSAPMAPHAPGPLDRPIAFVWIYGFWETLTYPSARTEAGARAAARERGVDLAIFHQRDTHWRPDRLGHTFPLRRDQIAGAILFNPPPSTLDTAQRLHRSGFPLVVCGRSADGIPSVCPDERAMARLAVEHLARAGHRQIAYLSGSLGNPQFPQSRPRLEAFIEAIAEADLPFDPNLVVEAGDYVQLGRVAMRQLLSRGPRPTGLVAYNDFVANGAWSEATEQGLHCPTDLAIVGMENRWLTRLSRPHLTSVALPEFELGYRAAAELIDSLRSGRAPRPLIELPPLVIQRESCGVPFPRDRSPTALLAQYLKYLANIPDPATASALAQRFTDAASAAAPFGPAFSHLLEECRSLGFDPRDAPTLLRPLRASCVDSLPPGPVRAGRESGFYDALAESLRQYDCDTTPVAEMFASQDRFIEYLSHEPGDSRWTDAAARRLRFVKDRLNVQAPVQLIILRAPSSGSSAPQATLFTIDPGIGTAVSRTGPFDFHAINLSSLLPTDGPHRCGLVCEFDEGTTPAGFGIFPWSSSSLRVMPEILWGIQNLRSDLALARFAHDLAQAQSKAEDASLAKTEFLAQMTHDLRTPLSAILGFADIAARETDPDAARSFCESIQQAARTMMSQIGSTLDFARIEARREELESVPFSIRQCVEDVLTSIAAVAEQKNLALGCSVNQRVPERLIGSPTHVRRILQNLLSNAVKFTDHGHVSLSLDAAPTGPSRIRLSGSVSDSGIGIPQECQRLIFDRFRTGPRSHGDRAGAGLGLAICSKFIELMHGELSVVSEPGQGATFNFTLELAAAAPNPPSNDAHARPDLAALRALILMRAPASARAVSATLQDLGVPFELCEPGDSHTLQSILERPAPPSLAIVDSQAPNADQAALLERAAISRNLALILASPALQRRIALPARTVLFQPILPWRLADAVRLCASAPLAPAPAAISAPAAPAPAPAAAPLPHRVLVVEDHPINRDLMLALLRRAGYTPIGADHGQTALDLLDAQSFDVILMDLDMPDLDGITCTRRIRSREAQRPDRPRIPIVGVTASVIESQRDEALQAGMDTFLAKPVEGAVLIQAIVQLIGAPTCSASS